MNSTRILSESTTVVEATPKIIQTICETLRWEFGEFWSIDQEVNALRNVEGWYRLPVSCSEFDVVSQITFTIGLGLPGRVWATSKPIWIEDVVNDANFLRSAQVGLHAAFVCVQEFRFVWQDKVFQIGVSIGLVAIDADSQSLSSVLNAADAACYAAKNQGRNRVHVELNDAAELC